MKWQKDKEKWGDRTCDRDRLLVRITCTGEKGSKEPGLLKKERDFGSSSLHQSCIFHHQRTKESRTDTSTGVVADRWIVRHAFCAPDSLRSWWSFGVRPWSLGVRTGPGQTGAGGTAVPVSVPVWGRWDLRHGGLLRVGTSFCSDQPQPSHHLPVSTTC